MVVSVMYGCRVDLLFKTGTVTEIRARQARVGGGVSKDAVNGAAISATTRSQGSFGSTAIRTPTSQIPRRGGLLDNTVQQDGLIEEVWGEGLPLQVA